MQPRTGAVPPHWAPERGRPADRAALRAVAGCALSAVLVAGCSTGAGTPPGADGSPAAGGARPSASAAGDRQAALDAYTAMWQEAAAASRKGGGATGELDRYATGAALLLLSEALAGADGHQVTGAPELAPEAEITGADSARVTDCLDDSAWNLGAGPASPGSGPRRVEAGLVHDGLAWRVSELRIWEPGTC
ncbi:hypothetical protein [Streptomonospora wellingtoniae]|uniref:Lipoprotein n=1 Tax=Streptomonospora wellingtoniae TaxID=3075544 RepID=A0ABU2KWY7_9ACTN|nr:hypothetical protein [Streptomonospora sp. DSM 45055]MDT0303613.1 hypothetical protein [Streptomonospora sp. DSM 45055]